MFYTALSSAGQGVKDQRVGVATSDDLFTWHRAGDGPLLTADPRWYLTLGLSDDPVASETWRDPRVFAGPDGDGWHMLITARAPGAARLDDGVLAHARSADLVSWTLGPPITGPAGFGQLEVPQVRVIEGQPMPHRQEYGEFCTWSVLGDSILGPWDMAAAQPFRAQPGLFAAPLVQDWDGVWNLLGFRNNDPDGVTDFEILDPIPVTLRNGALTSIQTDSLHQP